MHNSEPPAHFKEYIGAYSLNRAKERVFMEREFCVADDLDTLWVKTLNSCRNARDYATQLSLFTEQHIESHDMCARVVDDFVSFFALIRDKDPTRLPFAVTKTTTAVVALTTLICEIKVAVHLRPNDAWLEQLSKYKGLMKKDSFKKQVIRAWQVLQETDRGSAKRLI